MVQALEQGTFDSDLLSNVFQLAASQAFPGLDALVEELVEMVLLGRTAPCLTGAGPALFCLPASTEEYHRAAGDLQAGGARAYLVHTVAASPVLR
jgi:hypothetical protein